MRIGLVVEEFPGSSERFVFDELGNVGDDIQVFARRKGAAQLFRTDLPVAYLGPEGSNFRARATRAGRSLVALGPVAVRQPAAAARLLTSRDRLEYSHFALRRLEAIRFESPVTAHRYMNIGYLDSSWSVKVSPHDVSWLAYLDPRDRNAVITTLGRAGSVYTDSDWTAAQLASVVAVQVHRPRVCPGVRTPPRDVMLIDGPLDFRSGIEHTLLALQAARIAMPVQIAGGGPLLRYARFTALQLGLDQVEWLGILPIAAYERHLNEASVMISSSITDSATRAARLAEATNRRCLRPGATAFAPRDVVAMAAALRAVANRGGSPQ